MTSGALVTGVQTCALPISPGRPGLPFVNADRIARDRFPGRELEQAYEAARIAAAARRALVDARLDFCTETVFSHASKLDLVTDAVAASYDVVLHVVMIPVELSGRRVAARVAAGGHDVPTEKLRSEEHTSELQSLMRISYAVFCLKKK